MLMVQSVVDPDTRFSCLVERVVSMQQKDVYTTKSGEIADAVYQSVKVIVDEIGSLEPCFKVSEILTVGSYFEGTKIDGPNEFDFLLVLEELSEPSSIAITKRSDDSIEAKIEIQDEIKNLKWKNYVTNGFLSGFGELENPHSIRNTYGTLVVKAVRDLAKAQNKWKNAFSNRTSEIDFLNGLDLSSVNGIPLFLKKAYVRQPNTILSFEFEGYGISVDISPAIRYHDVANCFKEKYCIDDTIAASVINRGSLLLVSQRHSLFRITFTETEIEYMQKKLDKMHKMIYIFLKYIKDTYVNKVFQYGVVSSYILKTLIINHDIRCRDEEKNFSKCFDEVTEMMSECLEHENLPNVFNKTVTYPDSEFMFDQYRKCIVVSLKKIREMVDRFAAADAEDFQSCITDIVKESVKDIQFLKPEYLST